MNQKTFIGLAAVTVAAVIGAAIGVADRYGSAHVGRSEALVFEDLAERAKDVAQVVVQTGGGSVMLNRSDAGWIVPEKNGHPARSGKVREVILGLTELRLFEPKTRSPDKFARLQVEDVDAKGSASVLVTLADADGKELAKIIVGKGRDNLAGVVSTGVYVRHPGAEQAWLARGRLAPSRDAEAWLMKEIVDIPVARVSQLISSDAAGTVLDISKNAKSDAVFAVASLPEGGKLSKNAASKINGIAGALAGLELQDVVKAAGFAKTVSAKATIKTFDGLTIDVTLFDDDKKTWLRLKASGEGSVAEEAAKINARAGAWVYQLPDHKAAFLKTRMEDLLEKEKKDKSS